MTDKLDLAEEIAALRRALAANSTMLKQTMMNFDALDGWGKEANRRIVKLEESVAQPHARLEALEQWRSAATADIENIERWGQEEERCIARFQQQAREHVAAPTAERHQPANDNSHDGYAPVARAQKLRLIEEIQDLVGRYKEGIVSGDVWIFFMDLETILRAHRVG